jgi:lipid II:glycine glycyltransferase (peptidoglycan interpeptide bridge formation enzyme)
MMDFKILTAPCDAWDALYTAHSRLLFHSSTWFRVLQEGFRYPLMYYTLWDKGKLILGLPVFLMDYRLCRVLYATIPYGTIIGDYAALPHFLSALYPTLQAHKLHVMHLGGAYPNCPTLALPGYCPQQHPIHLLTLRGASLEEIQQQYKSYTRRDIRRAERFGIKVENIAYRGEIEDLYRLYLCSMQRNHAMVKYPKQFMYSIYDHVISQGQGDVFFATYDEKKIAGIMILSSHDMAHYYFGGSINEYQRYQPNEALLHHAIMHTRHRGKHVFDFMGSDAQDTALIRFKQKWGAAPHMTVHYTIELNAFRHSLWNAGLRVLSSPVGTACSRLARRLGSRKLRE